MDVTSAAAARQADIVVIRERERKLNDSQMVSE